MDIKRPRDVKTYPPGTEVRTKVLQSGVLEVIIIPPKPRTPIDERVAGRR